MDNETLQLIAVGCILALCIVWIIRRIIVRRKSPTTDCNSSCAGCSLAEQCRSNKSKVSKGSDCSC